MSKIVNNQTKNLTILNNSSLLLLTSNNFIFIIDVKILQKNINLIIFNSI